MDKSWRTDLASTTSNAFFSRKAGTLATFSFNGETQRHSRRQCERCMSNVRWLQCKKKIYRMVLSELPLTTNRSRYCRQAIPRLWPLSVRTNSAVVVLHTLIIRSPDADTMYLSSKSTALTAALWPTSTCLSTISLGEFMSHTAIVRSLNEENVSERVRILFITRLYKAATSANWIIL